VVRASSLRITGILPVLGHGQDLPRWFESGWPWYVGHDTRAKAEIRLGRYAKDRAEIELAGAAVYFFAICNAGSQRER
jgi:hypothetical protein